MKTTEEMIAVMQAALAGKTIECRHIDDPKWYLTGHATWNWIDFDYRVKPLPKRVPRTMDDLPKGGALWVRVISSYMLAVTTVDESGICWDGSNVRGELERGVLLYASESNIEISADRETWLPWWKEVSE